MQSISDRLVTIKEFVDDGTVLSKSDSGESQFEAFVERFEDRRHALSYRLLAGESLTEGEREELDLLNQILQVFLVTPPKPPLEVTAALALAEEVLGKR